MRELQREKWQEYFDKVSRKIKGKVADIEIINDTVGDLIETDSCRIFGLTYDPHSNVFEISCHQLNHTIRNPRKIMLQEKGVILEQIEVIGGDADNKEIIRLRTPISLNP